jgi:Phage tail lysozyme
VAETIREFVASLGFSINESQQRNFVGALEGATLRAKLLGDAIEAMAKTVAEKVGEVAEHFEQLFYQSSRVGSSVAGIQAFEFAFKQLGSSVGDADAALESFGYKLRTQPGFEGWVSRMGVATRDTNGQLRETSKIIPELAQHIQKLHNPALSNVFREALGGISDQGWRTLNNPEFWKQYNIATASEGSAGIDNDAAKRAAEFEQQWREVWKRIGDMADGGYTKLLTALTEPMQKFNDWLSTNSPQINDAIGKMATSVSALTTAWVNDIDKVHWGDVAKDFDNVTTSISKFVDQLSGMVGWLIKLNEDSKDWWFVKAINKTTGVTAAADDPAGEAVTGNSWWKRHAPTWMGGGGGGAPPGIRARGTGGAAPVGALKDRAMYMMDRLVKEHGWTPAAAAIAVGNAEQESTINPNGPAGDGGISHGMMQWNHGRFDALQAFAASQKKDWRDKDVQIDFLDAEARSKVPTWPSQPGLGSAGKISHAFEGYGDDSTGTREANAAKWLKTYQAQQATAAAPGLWHAGAPLQGRSFHLLTSRERCSILTRQARISVEADRSPGTPLALAGTR